MLQNSDYVSRGLTEAATQNNLMLVYDKARWFYKKWRGLMVNGGKVEKLESRLEGHMRQRKDRYRAAYEKGMIPYPTSVPFADYKNRLEHAEDMLLEVFRRIPKGGLLHVHSAAALSAEGLIALLKDFMERKEQPVIYIETAGDHAGKMSYHQQAAGAQMPLRDYFDLVPQAEERLREWLTLGAHTDHNLYIWDEFNQIFMRTSDLFENAAFYYEYHLRFFLECLKDRIDYVELRCGFQNFVTQDNTAEPNVVLGQSAQFLELLLAAREEAVNRYQDAASSRDWRLPFDEMGLGVILCARRDLNTEDAQDKEKLMKKIDAAIVWKWGPYSELIKGFDFVSEEDRGKASYTYYRDIYYGTALTGYTTAALQNAAASLKQDVNPGNLTRVELIDLMLHAGESLWMEQENIVDAKIASRWRIGHGYQMLEYPGALMEYMDNRYDGMPNGPILEVCPISNQMLRYFPDIRNHYALILMKMGVPCVLANDDPQILANPGLSYDFWEIYMASDGGLMLVKGLVFTAFLFHYQHRAGKTMDNWDDNDYEVCRGTFEKYYWEPFLEEMRQYFREPDV